MDDFLLDFEEAKYRASHTEGWSQCCDVLQLAANNQNIDLVAEVLKFQGVLIMQELWKMFPRAYQSSDRISES